MSIKDLVIRRIDAQLFRSAVLFFGLFLLVGCSRYPTAPELPRFSANKSSAQAVKMHDKNKDGKLQKEEWEQSPPLASIADRIDEDEDQLLTIEEIAAYMRAWQESQSHIVAAMPTFYLDGEPLEGAKITLQPAKFLGSTYPKATAVTNADGTANFQLEDGSFPGVFSGMYLVSVSKTVDGQESIPSKYNSETELGVEFSRENWTSCVRWFPLESN